MTAEENSKAGEGQSSAVELTEEQKLFIESCETEFAERYTDADQEFVQYKNRSCTPPIIDPWYNKPRRNFDWSARGNGGGRRHQHWSRNERGYNQGGQSGGWNQSGSGGGGYMRQTDRYRDRHRPY